MANLDIESVPFFDRPQSSGPKDRFIGKDEAGNSVFETVIGEVYTIKPAADQRTTRTKIEEDVVPAVKEYIRDPSLPSAEQMKQFGVDAVTGAYESVSDAVRGRGTYGDVFGVAGSASMSSVAVPRLPKTKGTSADPLTADEYFKFYSPSKESLKKEADLMMGPEKNPDVDLYEQTPFVADDDEGLLDFAFEDTFSYKKFDTLEDAVDSFKSEFKDSIQKYGDESTTGKTAKAKLKALEKLGEDFFIQASNNLPHWESKDYDKFKENFFKKVEEKGLDKYASFQLLNDLDSIGQDIYGIKISPLLEEMTEKPLPKKQQIGKRAFGGKERPSDKKAKALGFKDTVYHTSNAPEEFTSFDINQDLGPGSFRAAQDLLGVHVGTARAAAERNLVPSNRQKDPTGFTMELRARTTKPLTPKTVAKDFSFKLPTDKGLFDSNGNFTEKGLNYLIKEYHDDMFKGTVTSLPENSSHMAAREFSRELSKKGYTHIPYVNDIEDPGSTSLIMLVDRPKNSPAVLRDVRAKFDPDKITDPDLRFAEGGIVEKQMNRLYQEGGLADDGARVEPVTGNEVPPGSMDQEVRDNVDAKLSEGEYVVPADVVRYYGVRFFEDLRAKAKEDFSKMESEGRIGGEPVDAQGVPMEDDELTPEEMQMLAEALGQAPQGMAMGGMVQQQPIPAYNPYAQQQMQYNNPNTPMPVGMAEGGEVKAPEFNPSQYQLYPSGNQMGAGSGGGIEIVDYINVETGQIRPITLMNGQPMGLVPEGFVRATPENRKQAMENAGMASEQMGEKTTEEVLDVRDDSESEQRRMEQAGQTGASYTNWAEENYDKIQKDPVGYIKDKLTGKDTFGDKLLEGGARLAAGLGPIGIAAAGLGMGYKELRPLAEARAALKTMDPLSDQYKEAESIIEKYDDELKGIYNFADDTLNLASGDKLYEGLVEYGSNLGTPSTTSNSTTTRTSASTDRDSGEDKVTVSTDSTGVTRAASGSGGASVTVGSSAPKSTSTRPQARRTEGQIRSSSGGRTRYTPPSAPVTDSRGRTSEDEDFGKEGWSEGGFVARPSKYKSKVTRKTEKKRRGLGSK